MDEESLLTMVMLHVARGRVLIARQRRLIERLELEYPGGEICAEARAVLEDLEETQRLHEEHSRHADR